MKKSTTNSGVNDKVVGLLEERDGLLEDLARIEKELNKNQFEPERLVGSCYRNEGFSSDMFVYHKITGFERGVFNYVKVVIVEHPPKAGREDDCCQILLGRGSPGSFFDQYNELTQIPPQEFEENLNRFMGMVPR